MLHGFRSGVAWARVAAVGAFFLAGILCGRAQTELVETGDSLSITTNQAVSEPATRRFAFPGSGVFISTDFEGGRLTEAREITNRAYRLLVTPENFPVNDSAWYAFRIWGSSNQTVSLTLAYEHGHHRYAPQVSRDGRHWQRLAVNSPPRTEEKRSFTFSMEIGPEPLTIAAQELFTSKDFARWLAEISRHPFARASVLGKSALGRPIHRLEITEAGPGADVVLVIGRQHPPEVTGTFALRSFVESFCRDTEAAREFRRHFRLVVVPLVNPDGVDGGYWRHNAHGTDLNRDWGQFNQPEPRLIRDEFLRLKAAARLRFAIDFHSTGQDMFYTTSDENDLAAQWIAALQRRVPDHPIPSEGGSGERPTYTAAAWMHQELEIPCLTHETGDATDREVVRRVGEAGADALMQLLHPP